MYDREMPVVIHYFTDNKVNVKTDNYRMAEELIECLEYLNFKDRVIRGENINWHLVEDVLQVFITYKFRTQKQSTDLDNMNDVIVPNINTQQ